MDEPLSFDYQALADEQAREEKERRWQTQGRVALLCLVVGAAVWGLASTVLSHIPLEKF